MVNLIWTPRLERAFQKLDAISSSKAPLTSSMKTPWPNAEETQTVQEVSLLLQSKDRVFVEFDLIRRVSAMLLKYDRSTASPTDSSDASEDWVHVMIKGSAVYIPKPAPKERSPELDRIMDDVKAKLAEREYRRMISSIDYTASSNGSISSGIRQDMKELKEVKAHTIGIINVLYTGAAVFTAVYMISGHFTEDLGKRSY
ncbi:hypothetical protein BGZ99_001471 [Dissophora globulifera]|uniref:Uncharacterized protein n=1 Tax=Dissophora globulifera TaxID=979702 RepID=A0A9P6UXT0_9FUNG|nr:hypothetical protein BGZ99_001471 [Dissophora globulifera]